MPPWFWIWAGRILSLKTTRYFGRLSLDLSAVEKLGPEPLDRRFYAGTICAGTQTFAPGDQGEITGSVVVAGVGNIYASEALFRARISPKKAANRLKLDQVKALRGAIREVLAEAIEFGSTVPVNFGGAKSDGLFYFGTRARRGGLLRGTAAGL